MPVLTRSSTTSQASPEIDAVVVGAGFAGLYALHRLRGLGLRVRVFEAGGGIGGTWFWNQYPGARCDIESLGYSYFFCEALQQDWQWSERYAAQPELLRYISHVADRFDLRRQVELNTRVDQAEFDPQTDVWTVVTNRAERIRLTCRPSRPAMRTDEVAASGYAGFRLTSSATQAEALASVG